MNRVVRKWSPLLARILALTLVLTPILMSMAVPLTEAKGSRENDLRSGSRSADFNVTEEVYGNSPFALLNSQSLFDFSKIKRSLYTVSGSRLEIGIEWAEGHDFDIWCGVGNSNEPDCDNHDFQVDLGNGITIDKISFIDMWEDYLTIHIELGEYAVQCNQVINVSYQPSGRSSKGAPPDVPFSIEVLPDVDLLDQYDLQIKIKQQYLSYVEFMDSLKSLNLLEWYLTYINDLRVSEDGQHQLEFRIKPKLECLPSQVEHSIDLKVYTTDQYSLKLTPDQLKFAESDSDSLTLTFSNENSSDYQEFSIVAVDDEWAEKSSIVFMYIIVESENKIIENIGDFWDVTPFLVSAIFLEDNDEVIQVQPSPSVIKSNALQKFAFSLKAPLDKVSNTYVLVTLQGDKGRLLDPSYAEESSADGDVEGFVKDYIIYKISHDTWEGEEYNLFVQTMDEGNVDLHFLTFNDELLDVITHSFDSLFANGQKYLSGQFPKLTEFNFTSPINCSANQDCIFSLLPNFLLFHLVNEWVDSFTDLDNFLTEMRQEGSQFNTFISHYPFPDEFNYFQLFDDMGGIENTLINYMQFKIRDSSDPYLGIKHTERIEIRLAEPKLSGLLIGLTPATMSPILENEDLQYTYAITDTETSTVYIQAIAAEATSLITINNVASGYGSVTQAVYLEGAVTSIPIEVYANGITRTYGITVTMNSEVDPVLPPDGDNSGDGSPPGGGSSGGTTSRTLVSTSNGKITIPVGSAGVTKLRDIITVSIPAGAADQELIITIEELLDTAHLENHGEVFASPVFELLSNISGNFNKPVTLTFKYDPSKVEKGQHPVISYYDEENKKWVNIGGQVDGDTISVEVEYFAKFAVLVIDEESVPEMPKEEITFTDISRHWAEAQIRQAVEQGIVNGYPDGTFKPNSTVTRAEFTLMLMNAIKPKGEGTEFRFSDVQEIGTWAQTAVAQSVAVGIVTGYSDGTFRPNANITRAELAVMIARAVGATSKQTTSTGFVDDSEIPAWAKSAISSMKELGIISGRGDNSFAPQATATRAEAITLVMNLLQLK